MATQTKIGCNYGLLNVDNSRILGPYGGTLPGLGLRPHATRMYQSSYSQVSTAWTAGDQWTDVFNAGIMVWDSSQPPASTSAASAYSNVAAGLHDTAYRSLFRRFHQQDFGGAVITTSGLPGAQYGGTKPDRVLWTFHHEPDNDVGLPFGTAAEYKAAWNHLYDVCTAVQNDPAYNPGGTKRVYFASCPVNATFGATGWQPDGAHLDIFGFDYYFPYVASFLDPNALPPYIYTKFDNRIAQCDANYGTDFPMALGEFGLTHSETVANGGKGLDPNRLNSTSLRRRWWLDATYGVIDYFKGKRLADGVTPRFFVANYFCFQGVYPEPQVGMWEVRKFYEPPMFEGYRSAIIALTSTATGISAPTGLFADAITSSSVTIHWTNPAGSTQTKIYADGAYLRTTLPGVVQTSLTSFTAGSAHDIQLTAVAADGTESALSTNLHVQLAVATDTVPPSTPGNLRLSGAPTANSAAVAWDASIDTAPAGVSPSGVAGYRIYRNAVMISEVGAAVRTFNLTGLTPGASYAVTVSAFDAAGNEGLQTAALTVTTTSTADTTPPTVPPNVRALTTLTAPGAYGAAWDASTDNVGVAYYQVRVDGTAQSQSIAASTRQWTGTGAVGSTHTFEVRALDAASNASPWSAPITLTAAGGSQLPTPVLNLLPGAAGTDPFTVTADLSQSTDPQGSALIYTHHWGDGSPDAVRVAASTGTHTYRVGSYAAWFEVVDPQGNASRITAQIVVSPAGGATTPGYNLPLVLPGTPQRADNLNAPLRIIDTALSELAARVATLTGRWDGEGILRTGATAIVADILSPGMEVPYATRITRITFDTTTGGAGSGQLSIVTRYTPPGGARQVVATTIIPAGQTHGEVAGLILDAATGGSLTWDVTTVAATPHNDLRVHAYGSVIPA